MKKKKTEEVEENINPIDDWKAVLESLLLNSEIPDDDVDENWYDLMRYNSQILYIIVKWIIDISESDNLLGDIRSKITGIFEGKTDESDDEDKGPNPLVV